MFVLLFFPIMLRGDFFFFHKDNPPLHGMRRASPYLFLLSYRGLRLLTRGGKGKDKHSFRLSCRLSFLPVIFPFIWTVTDLCTGSDFRTSVFSSHIYFSISSRQWIFFDLLNSCYPDPFASRHDFLHRGSVQPTRLPHSSIVPTAPFRPARESGPVLFPPPR